jgi:Ca2+-binding EF-hand superfamily protein
VSKDEFNRFAKDRFANLDLDGDGKITEADLPPMMRGRGILK